MKKPTLLFFAFMLAGYLFPVQALNHLYYSSGKGDSSLENIMNESLLDQRLEGILLTGETSSVIFNKSDQALSIFEANSAITSNSSPYDMLTVQLYTTNNFTNGGPTHDSFGIIFAEGNDNAVTYADAIKPMNFYENLARDHNGTLLSLEFRDLPKNGEEFLLYSSGYTHHEYTLKMKIDGLEDTFFYLDDRFTGTSTMLEDFETAYNFSVDADDELSIATDRFSIRTEARLGVNVKNIMTGVSLYPNPLNENTFYINAPELDGESATISVNDMLGREIYNTQQTFSGSSVKIELHQDLKTGVYMVNLSSNGAIKAFRVINR